MMEFSSESLTVGLFVGGSGRRMGGCPKGNILFEDGQTVLDKLVRAAEAIGPVVLVGDATPYASLRLTALVDEPPGVGPIGGLHALLGASSTAYVLAVACDMPFVSEAVLRDLALAPHAPIVAACTRLADRVRWEPLLARYHVASCFPPVRERIAAGAFALQPLLAEYAVAWDLPAGGQHALVDLDTPADLVQPMQRFRVRG